MNVYKYNRVFMYIYDISDNARKKIARANKTFEERQQTNEIGKHINIKCSCII